MAELIAEHLSPAGQVTGLREALVFNDCEPVMKHLDAVLAAHGLANIDRTSPRFRLFAREAMRVCSGSSPARSLIANH